MYTAIIPAQVALHWRQRHYIPPNHWLLPMQWKGFKRRFVMHSCGWTGIILERMLHMQGIHFKCHSDIRTSLILLDNGKLAQAIKFGTCIWRFKVRILTGIRTSCMMLWIVILKSCLTSFWVVPCNRPWLLMPMNTVTPWSLAWEATVSSASWEISHTYNTSMHYLANYSSPLVLIMNHINPVSAFPACFFKIHF